MLRVVVDTNVLISGIGFSGIPHKILRAAINKKFQLVITPFIMTEAERKIKQKLKLGKALELEGFWELVDYELIADPTDSEIKQHLYLIPSDPNDVPIALVAIREKVDILVTGNTRDFLKPPAMSFIKK